MREVERQVMLQIIDQHWREHLYEMDYLQEGIHLRAYGQKDPLVEWQREGFEMFGMMMESIAQDFVKYVMHAQITVIEQPLDEAECPTCSTRHRSIRPKPASTLAAAAAAVAAEPGGEAPAGAGAADRGGRATSRS